MTIFKRFVFCIALLLVPVALGAQALPKETSYYRPHYQRLQRLGTLSQYPTQRNIFKMTQLQESVSKNALLATNIATNKKMFQKPYLNGYRNKIEKMLSNPISLSNKDIKQILKGDTKANMRAIVRAKTGSKNFGNSFMEFFIRLDNPETVKKLLSDERIRKMVYNAIRKGGGKHEHLMTKNFIDFLTNPKWGKDGKVLALLLTELVQPTKNVVLKTGESHYTPSSALKKYHEGLDKVIQKSKTAEEALKNIRKYNKKMLSKESFKEFDKLYKQLFRYRNSLNKIFSFSKRIEPTLRKVKLFKPCFALLAIASEVASLYQWQKGSMSTSEFVFDSIANATSYSVLFSEQIIKKVAETSSSMLVKQVAKDLTKEIFKGFTRLDLITTIIFCAIDTAKNFWAWRNGRMSTSDFVIESVANTIGLVVASVVATAVGSIAAIASLNPILGAVIGFAVFTAVYTVTKWIVKLIGRAIVDHYEAIKQPEQFEIVCNDVRRVCNL